MDIKKEEAVLKNVFGGFRDFIIRGNVVDLAVAVIIGAAFSSITTSLTADVLTPLIAALVGAPDFSTFVVHVPVLHHLDKACVASATVVCPGEIHIGKFLNSVVNFLLNSAAIYFLIVLPVHKLLARVNKVPASEPTTKACPQCLGAIPLAATRCQFCTQPV